MQRRAPSAAAVGWTVFAAFMMILLGCWWVIVGIVGLIDDDFYVRTRHYVFEFDTTSWGWIHLIVGAIVLISGFALYTGAVWARTVGVFVALLAALVAFAWLPWYPIWAILMVVAAISVIWALTAHGRDMAEM